MRSSPCPESGGEPREEVREAVAMSTVPRTSSPGSNGELAEVKVDWLSVTFKQVPLADVGRTVSNCLECDPDDWTELAHGILGYEAAKTGPGEAKVLSSYGREDVHVILPGQACSRMPPAKMKAMLGWVDRQGKPTRIDLAMDDLAERYRPGFVADEYHGPTSVTRAKRCTLTHQTERGRAVTGDTMHLGSPRSDRCLKVYDKRLESAGRIKAIRWELVSRRECAEAVMGALARRDDWGNVLAEYLVGFIDFRENGQRCSWYQELVGTVKAARVARAVKRRGLLNIKLWIQKYVAPSLALLAAASRWDLESLAGELELEKQRDRWTPSQRRMLAEELRWKRSNGTRGGRERRAR